MRILLCSLLCLGAALKGQPAGALTIKNSDPELRKLTILQGQQKTVIELQPSEQRQGVCESACEIETQDGDLYEFDGNESVTIEEGLLYIEDAANSK